MKKIKRKSIHFILVTLLLCLCIAKPHSPVFAQTEYKELQIKHKRRKTVYVPFEQAHNLIIVPVTINDSDTLRFILDTGVTHTLLTDLNANDALSLQYSRKINLFGLGEGDPIEALHSYGNEVRLPGIYGNFHDLIVPLENIFHLSENLGKPVNGLMGYEIFNSFIVDVDYNKQRIAFSNPKRYRKKLDRKVQQWVKRGKAIVLPIDIVRRKPYINVAVKTPKEGAEDVRLLVDLGASHALSLYSDSEKQFGIPERSFRTLLGVGLNGEIYGSKGRINALQLGDFDLDKPVTTFPDESAIGEALGVGNRNGSLGSDVLRRFNVIFDYSTNRLILRPNKDYKEPFSYNMSGMEIIAPIPGLPIYQVAAVRDQSPAQKAGIALGDQIMGINGTNIAKYTMSDVVKLFHSKPDKKIKLFIHRNGEYFKTEFVLKDDLALPESEEVSSKK